MDAKTNNAGKCPVMHGVSPNASNKSRSNRDWWPNQLNLKILHQHSALSNPMGAFNYADAFKKLDLAALKADIYALMTRRPAKPSQKSFTPTSMGCLRVRQMLPRL